jgi:hypothetical protein
VFSVLDKNSLYYQVALTLQSHGLTAFCTPFRLLEFEKFPMGNSVGCQGLTPFSGGFIIASHIYKGEFPLPPAGIETFLSKAKYYAAL